MPILRPVAGHWQDSLPAASTASHNAYRYARIHFPRYGCSMRAASLESFTSQCIAHFDPPRTNFLKMWFTDISTSVTWTVESIQGFTSLNKRRRVNMKWNTLNWWKRFRTIYDLENAKSEVAALENRVTELRAEIATINNRTGELYSAPVWCNTPLRG